MVMLRALMIGGLVLAWALAAPTAEAAKKNKKKGGDSGVVVAIDRGQDKDTGTITIKETAGKKKKNAAPAANGPERKFTITKDTKFERLGKKKSVTAANFNDLQRDAMVSITAKGGTAEKIEIIDKKKKKKNQA